MKNLQISEEFCKQLDELLIPLLGNHFRITKCQTGHYIFICSDHRIISLKADKLNNDSNKNI